MRARAMEACSLEARTSATQRRSVRPTAAAATSTPAAISLCRETRGSFASDHVGYAWLLVDDARGNVALAFLDATSVQLGASRVTTSADTLILQLDPSGKLAWSRDLGPNHDQIRGWAFNPLGELVIAGQSGAPDALDYELFVTKLAP
jgi:hypothetical protein